MSKYVVAVFSNESKAYEGVGAFKTLHAANRLTLHCIAVVAKDADGNAEINEGLNERGHSNG